MAIDISEDFNHVSGGFAVMRLRQPLGDAEPALSIVRLAGEPDKLGPNGWQAQAGLVRPRQVTSTATGTELLLGPEICNHLIEDMEVEITIPALGVTERVVWPYVAPSVHGDGGLGSMTGAAAAPSSAQPLVPQATVKHERQVSEDTAQEDTEQSDPDEVKTSNQANVPEPNRNMLWFLVGGGMLTAAAIAAYVLFIAPQEPEVVAVSEPDLIGEPQTEAVPEPLPQPEVAVDTTASLMDAARACQTDSCDAAGFYDIGDRLDAIGDRDNAFRVMDIAARDGSALAALWLARAYDPISFVPDAGLQSPDPLIAFDYYGQALAGGETTAEDAVGALCAALGAPVEAESVLAMLDQSQISTARQGNCQ